MADLDMVHRGSLNWLWWVLAIVVAGGLLWLASLWMEGSTPELETEVGPERPASVPATEERSLRQSRSGGRALAFVPERSRRLPA